MSAIRRTIVAIWRDGLGRRLITMVLLFNLSIATLITCFQLYSDYRTDLGLIADSFRFIRASYLPVLVESVWVADDRQLSSQLEGLLRLRDMESLRIVVEGQVQWSAGRRTSRRVLTDSVTLVRQYRDRDVLLGELHLLASLDNVLQRRLDRLLWMFLGNGLKTTLVAGFTLVLVHLMVTRHLMILADYAAAFDVQQPETSAVQLRRSATGWGRPDALDVLAQAMQAMHTSLRTAFLTVQRSAEALRESEAQYRRIVETANEGIWVVDASGSTTLVNARLAAMLGYEAADMLQGSMFDYIGQEDLDRAAHNLAQRRHGVAGQYDSRFRRKDGTELWTIVSAAPLYDASGQFAGALGMLTDITEHKVMEARLSASLQEKELLLQEIHHRVKNNLQIIVSLLELQARTVSDPPLRVLLRESQHRIRTMGLIHEQLYSTTTLTSLNFAHYIKALTDYLQQSYIDRSSVICIQSEIPEVAVALDTAIPCGLIINELVTNSLKYAFPTSTGGTIRIHLDITDAPLWRLHIGDDGIGLPAAMEPQQATTLGLRIVTTLVQQLQGTLDVCRTAGTGYTITFRAPTAA